MADPHQQHRQAAAADGRQPQRGQQTAGGRDTDMPQAAPEGLGVFQSPTASPASAATRARAVSGAGASSSRSPDFPSPRRNGSVVYSDRFIPSRSATARQNFSALDRESAASESARYSDREDSNPAYQQLLQSELLGRPGAGSPERSTGFRDTGGPGGGLGNPSHSPAKKMLRFQAGDRFSPIAGPAAGSPFIRSPIGSDAPGATGPTSPRRTPRKIAKSPYKVLDAPALQDDFYLNLVDWSAQNVLAVGLGTCVYLWSAATSRVHKLCELGTPAAPDSVCSVAWSGRGSFLAVGTARNETQIWDVQKSVQVRSMAGHRARVGCMAWSSHLLSTGSRDKTILQRDVRAPEDWTSRLAAHRSEVCGLKWSPDDRQLASGGNDNQLYCWSASSSQPVLRFDDHQAAVKAIAWSPHQHGLLASGGGTADRCIRFWNTASGAALTAIDTGSQVCNLSWSRNVNEIVSTHGYSQNQVCVWRWPGLAKLATLTGHSMRVLYLAVSPDGQTIVTGAGDETLRFWSVFPGAKVAGSAADESSVSTMMRAHIR